LSCKCSDRWTERMDEFPRNFKTVLALRHALSTSLYIEANIQICPLPCALVGGYGSGFRREHNQHLGGHGCVIA